MKVVKTLFFKIKILPTSIKFFVGFAFYGSRPVARMGAADFTIEKN